MSPENVPESSPKRRQIVAAGETLFQLHGIRRVTVEEICRTAGVSKMTFYKHFRNKIALVKYIWEGWVEVGFRRLEELSHSDIPFPDRIEAFFQWKWSLAAQFSPLFLEDFRRLDIGVETITRRFMDFIAESQKRGDIRPEINPVFIRMVLEKLYELGGDEDLRNQYPSQMEFNREFKDFLWYGLLPRSEAS